MTQDKEPKQDKQDKQHEDLELPEKVAEDVKGGVAGWKVPQKLPQK